MPSRLAPDSVTAALLLAVVVGPLTANPASGAVPGAETAALNGATAPFVKPFLAQYTVLWKGVNAANASLELRQDSPTHYTYLSRNSARGIFKLAFPDEIQQTSVFTIEQDEIRPVSYRADDGTPKTDRDIALDFDWTTGRVTGTAEKRAVDVALKAGTQDGMSVQIALMRALSAGRSPTMFWLIDNDKLKDYEYRREGAERLRTAIGEVDTVIYSSRRPGSDRVTRIWYAASLDYSPVQADRRRGEKLEWSMRIKSLRR